MGRFAAILGAIVITATACGAQQAPAASGPAASGAAGQASAAPVPGGRIVLAQTGDPKTLQPVISTDTTSSGAWGFVYLSLVRADQNTGETTPYLAQKFDVSPDGKTVTYTLRDSLVWSDGTPFTGEDYRYTVEAVMRSKKTVRKSQVDVIEGANDYRDGKTDRISGIQVSPDGKVITLKLTKVFCPGIASLGGGGAGGILPSKLFKAQWDNTTTDTSKNIDDIPYNMAPPASMGPFVFKSFQPGIGVNYTRNDKFFMGAPLADELVLKNYADATAVKNALLAGELTYSTVSPSDYEEASKADFLSFTKTDRSAYTYIGWNAHAAKAPWLANVQVRQALAWGIDTPAIVNKVLLGFGHQIYSHDVPVSWAYDDSGFTKYSRDVAKAKQLLEQAGAKMGSDGFYRWSDGSPMKMRIETDQSSTTSSTILQFAQAQYKDIGIQIDPLLESFNALLDRTDPGTDYEGFIIGWSLGADPDPYSIWHSSQQGPKQFNDVFYTNKDVDKALEDNRNGPDCSKEARKKALHTVDLNLNRDVPYTFLYANQSLYFNDKKLQGFQPGVYSVTYNINQWWFKK